MDESERESGSIEPESPPKGRQQVRRHWKPSLGRFVDRYIRKGEHAKPGEPGYGDGLDGGETGGAGVRSRRKLLLVAGAAVALVTVAFVVWRIARPSHAVNF